MALDTDTGNTWHGPRVLEDVLDATNAGFTRLRHTRDAPAGKTHEAVEASHSSVAYIQAFWPHVAALIESDPRKLGLSVVMPVKGRVQRVEVGDVRDSIVGSVPAPRDEREVLRVASALAALRIMTDVMNAATGNWANELQGGTGCPLDFDLDAERYVSLRALLHRRENDPGAVGANAPTLVMGGTATALAMCWNLLYRLPGAWRELHGTEISRESLEQQWASARELIFRIGSGSLTAFVAFASACASDTKVLLWDGTADLGLAEHDGRTVWTMNAGLYDRYLQHVASVRDAQQGSYVGCAALYARTEPLPLDPAFADPLESGRQTTVFAEVLRWMTAAARAEYFPLFEAGS